MLIKLQDCDSKIQVIVQRQMEGPEKIKKLEDALNDREMKFKNDSSKLESLNSERRHVEKEIQDLESAMEKSDMKLTQIKSNKEYTAALKEIEELKKAKFTAEDRVIEIMEAVEEVERKCDENRATQDELRKEFEQNKAMISKELQALDKELDKLKIRRGDFSQTVDQELLDKYQYLKERKGGKAISPVIGGICQTCHMGIPPQKFNELLRGNSLMTCPNCNRLIYWGDDAHFQEDSSLDIQQSN
jgi:predicted  nucleic acid-binding Zn-ribbon protein